MLKRKLTTLCVCVLLASCGGLTTAIKLFNGAPVAINRLPIAQAVKESWSSGSLLIGARLVTYDDADKSTKEKKRAERRACAQDIANIVAKYFIVSDNPAAERWKNDILAVVRIMFNLPPPVPNATLVQEARAMDDAEDFKIREADLKKLKHLLENPPAEIVKP